MAEEAEQPRRPASEAPASLGGEVAVVAEDAEQERMLASAPAALAVAVAAPVVQTHCPECTTTSQSWHGTRCLGLWRRAALAFDQPSLLFSSVSQVSLFHVVVVVLVTQMGY